jgi:hypothetical protein
MTLRAVRADRPMVLTDAAKRSAFLDSYVNVVLQAFDEAAAFDQGNGRCSSGSRPISPGWGRR